MMKTCMWHSDGKRKMCGNKAVSKILGGYICKRHTELARKIWSSDSAELIKPYKPRLRLLRPRNGPRSVTRREE